MKQDFSKAREWFEKVAKQGLAEAQCNLGIMYENGYGVDQSDSNAMRWHGRAAAQGHEKAQEQINGILAGAAEKRRTKAAAMAYETEQRAGQG